MNWFWIALAAPALWAAVIHIDKYIISKYFTGKGVGSLILFTSLSGLIVSAAILVFKFPALSIGWTNALFIGLNGAFLVAAFIPYLYALEDEDASLVTALYQLIPVFSYALALIFLHERLNLRQILASLLVVIGAVIISLDLSVGIRFKLKPALLMILSAFMIALSGLIFKVVALDSNFWGTAFWEYAGGFVFGLALFALVPLYRAQFFATIEKSRAAVLTLNLFSELLNIIAKLLANFASLLAPLALVYVVNGFQPLIVFLYGLVLTLFLPQWGREQIGKRVVVQRVGSILVMFLGIYFLLK